MKIISFISFILLSNLCFNQIVMKLSDSDKKFKNDSLRNIYFDRLLSDEIIEVFETSTDFFIKEWRGFTQAYGRFLHDNHFDFGKQMKGQIEVYFNKNEKIDLFFIEIRDQSFPQEKYTKLLELTKEFAKNYKFTLDASKPFMNSGSITFIN
jgi:hypothetical protein